MIRLTKERYAELLGKEKTLEIIKPILGNIISDAMKGAKKGKDV